LRVVVWFGAALLGAYAQPSGARADQFVVVDATYTATADNTDDSHFRVDPADGTPDDWRSPIDYASGKAYVRLEVIEKPSTAKTLYNICYEATPSYACMPYSPTYTAPGVYEFDYPFSAFYQDDQVDWSQGIRDIALILKDENQVKPQGDPDFYPTKIHVTITIVAPGSEYVPPAATADAGSADASVALDAGSTSVDSGTTISPAPDAGHAIDAGHASAAGSGGSMSSSAPPAMGTTTTASGSGGQASPPPSAPVMAPVVMPEPTSESNGSGSSGCSTAPPGSNAGLHWLLLAAALPLIRALLRRRPKSQGDVDG
jgi:hypothetical protein